MNWHENDDPRRPPENDALDEVLRAAVWPEPTPGRLGRLQRRWRQLSRARVGRRRFAAVVCLVTTAAGVLIAISLWAGFTGAPRVPREMAPAMPPRGPGEPASRQIAEGPRTPMEAPDEPAPVQETKKSTAEVVPVEIKVETKQVVRSRPATTYEKLAFLALTGHKPPPTPRQPDEELVEAALKRSTAEPAADLDKVAEPLRSARGANELLLIEWVGQSRGARQLAAIDLLGRVGSQRSVPVLARLAAFPETHAAAVLALARLADSETIARLAEDETDPDLKQDLFAALLAAGDFRSVVAYLEFVGKSKTRASALAALERVAEPPLGLLFEFLDSPQQAQRSAVAVVLGHLDRPEVSERLIQMVVYDVKRQEALLALVASPATEASQFVALARRNPSLAGLAHAAQYRLKRFFPLNVEVN